MTRWLVVDASVAIKWIIPEEDSGAARQLIAGHRLIAPHLIYAECANVIWKKVRRKEISAEEATEAAALVDTFYVETVSLRELVSLALEISLRLDHPVYDCFYLSLAVLQDCPLVTADAALYRKLSERLEPLDATRCIMLGAYAPSQ